MACDSSFSFSAQQSAFSWALPAWVRIPSLTTTFLHGTLLTPLMSRTRLFGVFFSLFIPSEVRRHILEVWNWYLNGNKLVIHYSLSYIWVSTSARTNPLKRAFSPSLSLSLCSKSRHCATSISVCSGTGRSSLGDRRSNSLERGRSS